MTEQQGGPILIQFAKNSLNGGELSPAMACRFDVPKYNNGSRLLLNMIPLATGGITKRPPLRFVASIGAGQAWGSRRSRLIPFVYSQSIQFMLLLTGEADGQTSLYWLDRDGSNAPAFKTTLPYLGKELPELSFTQCGKVIYFAHANHKPGKVIINGISPKGSPSISYEQIDFRIKTPSPASVTATYISQQWSWDYVSEFAYVATAIDKKTGEESLPSPACVVNAPNTTPMAVQMLEVSPVQGCEEYRIYKKQGGSYGFIGRIVKGESQFKDDGIEPDMTDSPPSNPENCFDTEGDYPSLVFIHQQRLGFAASDNDPLTIWMSQISNFECRASKLPPNDDDAIEATLAATEANRILWAIPDRSGLAIGTEGAEWYLTSADGDGAISPNSLSFQPQTAYGSEQWVKPCKAGPSLIFCQRGGRYVRNLGYSFQADKYEASDLSLMAHHLFRFARIKDWAWQGSPDNILWLCTDKGQLLGMTLIPEQEVLAWHRHETPYGQIDSLACLDDSEGRARLWAVVLRNLAKDSGEDLQYGIEIMDPRFEGMPDDWDREGNATKPVYADGPQALTYRSRCIPCLPEINTGQDTTFLKVKKLNAIKVRALNSGPFLVQVKSQSIADGKPMPVPMKVNAQYMDYADWAAPLGGGFREGSQIELIMDGPEPVSILGMVFSIEVADMGGAQ